MARLATARLQYLASRLRGQTRGDEGFTLVEVIVAIALLSIGLSVCLGMITSGVRQIAQAEKMAEAGSLVQSLLAEVGATVPIQQGESAGQFPGGFNWQLKMSRYGDAREREAWPVGAYVISAEVAWDDGAQKRVFALTTLRLGPKAVAR
jgi:general secretion pathway protein I